MRTKKLPLILALSLALLSGLAHGQSVYISGPSSSAVGETEVYSANWDFSPDEYPDENYFNWWADGGDQIDPDPGYWSYTSCRIRWTMGGEGVVWYRYETYDNYWEESLLVYVSSPTPLPEPPVLNNATNITATSFTASWRSVASATSYQLEVSADPTSWGTLAYHNSTVNGTTDNVTGLSGGTIYYYRVRAVNEAGMSMWTMGDVLTIPAAPTVYNASNITASSFTANWSSVPNMDYYLLDVSTVTSFSSFVPGYNSLQVNVNQISQSVTGLSPATTYYYRVRSENDGVESENSDNKSVLTTPSVNSGPIAVCVNTGGHVYTTDSGMTGYSWNASGGTITEGQGTSSATVTWNTSGSQSVSVHYTNANGISSVSPGTRSVTVNPLPTPPIPYAKTRCGPGNVTLSTNNSGFAEYQWYDQNVNLLGSTTSNSFSVSTDGLTAYTVKVKDGYGCWSGMSSSAVVTTTHTALPTVSLGSTCGPGTQVTMYSSYYGQRSGNYEIEWYTTASGGDPEYSATVSQYENDATYSPYLSANKDYWVTVYDAGTSYDCRTERTHIVATVGSAPYAWGTGYSCEYYTAHIQAQGSSTISTYYLFRYEDTGGGLTYNQIDANSSGSFLINYFDSDDTQYVSNYYVRGRTAQGCWSSYSNVGIDVLRPVKPSVSGSLQPCYNTSTTLTASGGYEGAYRWYEGTNLLPGETGSVYTAGPLTVGTTYYVSYIDEGMNGGQCESPKEQVSVAITPLPEKPSTMNPSVRRCETGMISLEVWGHYNDFQWYDANDNAISGATSSIYSVQLDQLDDEKVYTVRGISGEGCESELTVLRAAAVADCENYVHDQILSVRGVTSETQLISLTADQKAETWNYLDGLGRPMQAIGKQASPEMKDMIKVFAYDDLGREAESVLPYRGLQSDGGFRSTAMTEILTYYQDRFADNSPKSVSKFMDSPLSRLAEQGGVGSSWQPNPTTPENGKTKKFTYGTNDSETVLRWTVTSTQTSEAVSISSSTYPLNTLAESTLVDDAHPDHLQSVTYKDFLGNTILQKEQIDASEWAETYYIYDDFGQLRVVLPPQGVWAIKNQNLISVSGSLLDDYAFLYLYDDEGRTIAEKSPGAAWVYNVYDRHGQLVLTQDGNQRPGNQWNFYKYDVFGRPALTGLVTLTATVAQIRADVESHAVTSEDRGSTVLHYTNNAYPAVSDPNAYLTAVYYDDIKTVLEAYSDLPAQSNLPGSVLQEMDNTQTNKGLMTHTKSRIVGTNEWFETSYFYDKYHNNVYTVTKETSLGSRLARYWVENFYNAVSNELDRQITTASTGSDEIGLVKRFEYDHGGRIEKEYCSISNEGAEPEVMSASYDYNELGQLVNKKIHSEDGGATWLQSQDYAYNLHGGLTSLNSLTGDAGDTDYFGFDMAFDNSIPNAGNAPRYDGMISAMRWSDDLTSKENLYNFNYDGLNRLTSSAYKKGASGVWTDQNKYSEDNLSYDLNGNITALRRYQGNGLTTIDNLTYDYGSGGNQLKAVSDNASEPGSGFGDGNNSGDDYSYDANGNLVFDLNRTITAITYNHLNLPEQVTFATPSQVTDETIKFIRYAYTADGTKLRQTYVNTVEEVLFTISYIGEFVAVDGEFHSGLTSQGRVVAPSYTNLISNREANGIEGFSANQSVTLSSVYQNGETYVKVVNDQSGSSPGVFPIGGTIAVKEGERYALKVLGYREMSDNAHLYVRGNTNDIVSTGALLPEGQLNEDNARTEFVIPSGVTQISVGVLWDNPSVGATFYINRVALYKLDWEYQYYLTDHLGSPRVVLGSDGSVVGHVATFETESQSTEADKFLNIQYANVVPHTLANATLGGNEVIRLNNTYRVGPSKSFEVFPGDKIDASVYAYYDGVSQMSQTPVTTMAAAVFSAMGNGVSAVDAAITAAYNNSASSVPGFLLSSFQGSDRPSAFINYILFDQDFVPIEAKSVSVGSSPNTKHQISLPQIEVKELGHLFVYLSYDNESSSWVHFDELRITYTESPVIQVNAYYPYGLLAYSWTRDGEVETREKFQGKEYDESTGWHDFHARQYDASVGRWFAMDPAGQFASPYLAMGNRPIVSVDPDGKFVHIIIGAAIGGIVNLAVKAYQGKIDSWGDGFAAFGIGAVAGAVGAATGGAVFMAAGGAAGGAGGFLAGFAGGAVGAAYSMPLQSIGNTAYFGDPLMTPKQYATGILLGGVLGGSINGGIALGNGRNFWTGNLRPVPSPVPLGVPNLNYQKPTPNYEPKLDKNIVNIREPLRDGIDNLPTAKPDNIKLNAGDLAGKTIKVEPLTLSPRQNLHYGPTATPGRSILTANPNDLVNQLNQGNFTLLRAVGGNKFIVDFGRDIGFHFQNGVASGASRYGVVILNSSGQIHVYPANPFQF